MAVLKFTDKAAFDAEEDKRLAAKQAVYAASLTDTANGRIWLIADSLKERDAAIREHNEAEKGGGSE